MRWGEDGFVEESINPARILAAGQESCRGRARGSAGARGKAAGCRRARAGGGRRARAVWRRDRARGGCRARAAVRRSGGGGGARSGGGARGRRLQGARGGGAKRRRRRRSRCRREGRETGKKQWCWRNGVSVVSTGIGVRVDVISHMRNRFFFVSPLFSLIWLPHQIFDDMAHH